MKHHSRLVRIEHGKSSALVYPEQGFQLHGFEVALGDHRRVEAIYGPPDQLLEPWDRRYGNPILFPNIVDANNSQPNSWDLDGRALLMPKHGWARDLYWHVDALGPSSVTGVLEPTDGALLSFPFEFRLVLTYTIGEAELTLDAALSNRGQVAFPYGFGFHPYLRAPLGEGTRKACTVAVPGGVRVKSDDSWRTLLREDQPACTLTLHDDLERGVILERTGVSELSMIDSAARLETRVSVAESEQPMPVWCVWSPSLDAPYVCLEPWTDSPNPLNRATRQLVAGETHRYRMSIAVRAL